MKKSLFIVLPVAVAALASCASSPEPTAPQPAITPDVTVEQLARIVNSPPVAVRGFGIVAGLFGTGSSECPPQLRQELEKYIWQQLPKAGMINPRRFIESTDTAVVEVLGVIPPMAATGQTFDVVVRPLSSTQTTSLKGGHLYATNLKEMSRITQFNQYARTIARAEGPIFSPPGSPADNPDYYVLGGGAARSSTTITLLLDQPDFVAAGAIRDRINERFGPRTANAVSPGEIQLRIPRRYTYDKEHFLRMIRGLHLVDQPALQQQRIAGWIEQLKTAVDKYGPEAALEAIGNAALDELSKLLDAEDEAVRFHAARCMSNIGSAQATPVLREFVFNPNSPYRSRALKTIGRNASAGDTEPILLRALAQNDIDLRIAAYETARAARSSIVSRTHVADSFVIDRVYCAGPKVIYARQDKTPGFVIFGSPIRCSDNIFLQSDDGQVTVNVRPGDRFISVSRTHPGRPRVVGPLPAGFEVSQLIRALAEAPEQQKGRANLLGLALSYGQVIEILEKMTRTQAIPADFVQGPMITAGQVLGNM